MTAPTSLLSRASARLRHLRCHAGGGPSTNSPACRPGSGPGATSCKGRHAVAFVLHTGLWSRAAAGSHWGCESRAEVFADQPVRAGGDRRGPPAVLGRMEPQRSVVMTDHYRPGDEPTYDAETGNLVPSKPGSGSSAEPPVRQLDSIIENLANYATPVLREIAARAAELAAKAGEAAGPMAQRGRRQDRGSCRPAGDKGPRGRLGPATRDRGRRICGRDAAP